MKWEDVAPSEETKKKIEEYKKQIELLRAKEKEICKAYLSKLYHFKDEVFNDAKNYLMSRRLQVEEIEGNLKAVADNFIIDINFNSSYCNFDITMTIPDDRENRFVVDVKDTNDYYNIIQNLVIEPSTNNPNLEYYENTKRYIEKQVQVKENILPNIDSICFNFYIEKGTSTYRNQRPDVINLTKREFNNIREILDYQLNLL